ncbi:hypothetical protein [Thomasclavelia cocleata]|jgi:hypothetical protein|uniref:hypothetical protein n=1 Tax=Thomasclavelia cocleata TaxID=69824 RepID=UPI002570C5BC|nr:hypothetical protein [Thomasclavelia cocleata]
MTMTIQSIINLIEAVLFPFFIAHYFDLQNKKQYICAIAIIHFLILNFCSFFYESNLILTFLILASILISIYYMKGSLTFNHIFITILYNCLILISALSVIIINNILNFIFSLFFTYHINFFLISCLISRILLTIITIVILHKKINLSLSFNLKYWYFIIILEFLLLFSIGIMTCSFITGELNNNILIALFVSMIMIAFLFVIILFRINRENKIKIHLEKTRQKETFENQKIDIIKKIKNEIDTIDHRMFYVLYNVELLLKQKNYEEAILLIELYRTQTNKYKLLIDTKNAIFDCLFSLNINKLITDGVDISTCITISQNTFYDNFMFISILFDLINLLRSSSSIIINISEVNGFSIIKLYYTSYEININQIEDIILKFESHHFNVKYSIDDNQIKLSAKMEDNND